MENDQDLLTERTDWPRAALQTIDWPQPSATLTHRILQALDDAEQDGPKDAKKVPPAYVLGGAPLGAFRAPRWFASLLLAGFVAGAAMAGMVPSAVQENTLLSISPYYAGAGAVMLTQMVPQH